VLKKIHFISLFPDMIRDGLSHSLMGKARDRTAKTNAGQAIELQFTQIRDFATNKHKTVDDTPYGGGAGMLLKADVMFDAWSAAVNGTGQAQPDFDAAAFRARPPGDRPYTILLSPQGPVLTQERAKTMVRDLSEIVIVTGHYEGVDERFIDLCVDEELSIGDYVLTGGEYAALVVADVLVRLIPGVVQSEESVTRDSLENGLLKAPQYTRPREFKGLNIPEVLVSGNHALIEKWRDGQSRERTERKRPDLWQKVQGGPKK
jgi:tRNA (guanine37-N1)-methyltransferase